MATISDETRATIDLAEPNFAAEASYTVPEEPPAAAPAKRKGGPGRGHKGAMGAGRSHKKKAPAPVAAAETPTRQFVEAPTEPPKSLVKGCKWMLRNVVTVMKDGYGWDEPEDYEEWLVEASQFGAGAIQKHFPDWMDQWGDEILLIAMLLLWATPNVSRKLRERKKQAVGDAGTEGQRQNNPTVPFAQSA